MTRTGVMAPYGPLTPYLIVERASALIAFLQRAFAADVIDRSRRADGSLMHAGVRVYGGVVMLSDAQPEFPAMPAMLYIYAPDADAAYASALAAGAESVMAPYDADYGDRNAGVRDPSGNIWWLATAGRDVTTEQLEASRAASI